jgi:hypothetical protein
VTTGITSPVQYQSRMTLLYFLEGHRRITDHYPAAQFTDPHRPSMTPDTVMTLEEITGITVPDLYQSQFTLPYFSEGPSLTTDTSEDSRPSLRTSDNNTIEYVQA